MPRSRDGIICICRKGEASVCACGCVRMHVFRYYTRGRCIANKRIDTYVVLRTPLHNTSLHLVTIDAALRIRYARILFIPRVDYVETIMAGCRSSIFTDVTVNRLGENMSRRRLPTASSSPSSSSRSLTAPSRRGYLRKMQNSRKRHASRR